MKKLLLVMLSCFLLCACNMQGDEKTDESVNQNLPKIEEKSNEIIETKDKSGENLEGDFNEKEIFIDDEIENQSALSGENIENDKIKVEPIEASSASLENTKCAWGFVRKKDNVQPEFSSKYTNVLDNYEGIYVGNKEEKNIYLTFDEGYENGYTSQILDTLKEKEVTAVFFVTMPYVKQNPDLVRRMIDEGHIVGNHTVNHPSMPEVLDDEKVKKEVMDLHEYVKENFNYEMTYIRPPKGEYSERTVKLCKDIGYTTVLWSSAYDDWDTKKQDRLDYAKKMILNNLHNGCVMLLHAVSKDNTALLPEVIDEVRNQGYTFKSLDEFEV